MFLCTTAIVSCHTETTTPASDSLKSQINLSEIRVNTLNPLIADLSIFDLKENAILTKAGSEADCNSVSLESLLDRKYTERVEGYDGGEWSQTPIIDTDYGTVFLSDEISVDYSPEMQSRVRRYLIESPSDYFVVTMIPYYIFSESDWSYFNLENFFGTVILSTLEGELIEIQKHHPDGFRRAVPVTNPEDYDQSKREYINIAGGSVTRAYGCTLEAAICIAEVDNDITVPGSSKTTTIKDDTDEGEDEIGRGGGGGRKELHPKSYTLSLYIQGEGMVSGAGRYAAGTIVDVRAMPTDSSKFAYWTGDLSGSDMWTRVLMPRKSISATALFLFDRDKPCYDAATGTYFPLSGTNKLAPTSTGGSPSSGSYGNVRNGGTKPHRGWDIEAAPGTPFYSPVDGVISEEMWTSTPNATNGRKGCGNRIGIKYSVGGSYYTVFFLHLAYTNKQNPKDPNNGIGVNPRTGRTWATGDVIYAGDMIGLTGDTGSAYNVDVKHLHVEIHNTEWWPSTLNWDGFEDPSILFGDILTKGANGRVVGYEIKHKCDEKGISDYQKIPSVYFFEDSDDSVQDLGFGYDDSFSKLWLYPTN